MNKELNRVDLHNKIDKVFDLDAPVSTTINFDGHGGFKLESKLGHKAMMQDGCIEAINQIITNKKE